MSTDDKGRHIILFPSRPSGAATDATLDDVARWLRDYADEIRARPADETILLEGLILECRRVPGPEGDLVHGLTTLLYALLDNPRRNDAKP